MVYHFLCSLFLPIPETYLPKSFLLSRNTFFRSSFIGQLLIENYFYLKMSHFALILDNSLRSLMETHSFVSDLSFLFSYFEIFSLPLVFCSFNMICLGVDSYLPCLLVILFGSKDLQISFLENSQSFTFS